MKNKLAILYCAYGKKIHDQPSLRRLAYFTDLRVATLPEEYNFRKDLKTLSKWHTIYIHHRR